jgi:hypothetical protein
MEGVGQQLAHQQFGIVGKRLKSPLMEHLPSMCPAATDSARQRAKLEAADQRPAKEGGTGTDAEFCASRECCPTPCRYSTGTAAHGSSRGSWLMRAVIAVRDSPVRRPISHRLFAWLDRIS